MPTAIVWADGGTFTGPIQHQGVETHSGAEVFTGGPTIGGGATLGASPDDPIGFYGRSPVAQRPYNVLQQVSNLATVTELSQLVGVLAEVMNTLVAYGLWSGQTASLGLVAPGAPPNIQAGLMADTQTVTVTWTDPTVGTGQAALKSLQVYSALVSGGPNALLGSVNPGVQTFTSAAGQLAPGTAYYFTVAATDINGVQGPDGTYIGPLTTSAAPSPPTSIQATLSP